MSLDGFLINHLEISETLRFELLIDVWHFHLSVEGLAGEMN